MFRYFNWWNPIFVLGAISILTYSINLERLPHNDELYHLLAAQGLLATGEPAIGEDGRYWRGYPFTWLVAQSIDTFGVSLTAARLPSVLFMALLVILLFGFLRREAGTTAAWLGAGLFAMSPFAIEIAQFSRFYSLQCLLFFTGAWLVYAMVNEVAAKGIGTRSWPLLLVMGCAAGGLIGFAVVLQQTTLLGLAGVAIWGGATLLLAWSSAPGRTMRARLSMIISLIVVGGFGLVTLLFSGELAALWAVFRTAPLFNEATIDHFWWYHAWYVLFYPTLWTLVGILAVFALIARPQPAWFLLTVFVVGFLLNSLAGPKNLRYLAYAQPFLFGLWGIGLAYAAEHGSRWLLHGLPQVLGERLVHLPRGWVQSVSRTLVYAALGYAVLVNPAWLRSVTFIADIPVPPERPATDWPAAQPMLQPWLSAAEVVVVGEELNPLYFYGRADILLSASRYYEIPEAQRFPFAPDHRTDVPSIPDAASLERVIDCHISGLLLIEAQFWGPRAVQRDRDVEALVARRTKPLDLPQHTQLLAFVWETDPASISISACATLPTFAVAPNS